MYLLALPRRRSYAGRFELVALYSAFTFIAFFKAMPFLAVQCPSDIQLSKILHRQNACATKILVGLGRLELPTSPLSGVRSSHLSYRPKPASLVELVGIEPATS
jgi:hypothetical protein